MSRAPTPLPLSLSARVPPAPAPRLRASLFRSAALELRVDSPRVQPLPAHGAERPRTIPVIGPHDAVTGAVAVDSQFCAGPGKLTVTVSRVCPSCRV
jgi:hypothetical protein